MSQLLFLLHTIHLVICSLVPFNKFRCDITLCIQCHSYRINKGTKKKKKKKHVSRKWTVFLGSRLELEIERKERQTVSELSTSGIIGVSVVPSGRDLV